VHAVPYYLHIIAAGMRRKLLGVSKKPLKSNKKILHAMICKLTNFCMIPELNLIVLRSRIIDAALASALVKNFDAAPASTIFQKHKS
jgi:hypothetical protein